MKKLIVFLTAKTLRLFQPTLSWILLRNIERLKTYQDKTKNATFSGMVAEFNIWHKLIFLSFFRRVQYLGTDISKIKSVNGPIVFVMKNRGQLEYRYFNYLFLKEKMAPVHYANNILTLWWWPVVKVWQILVCALDRFYKKDPTAQKPSELKNTLVQGRHALLNLSISRDYLFGLIKTDPLDVLQPLVEIQKEHEKPIHIVTLQFMFDKHPDKSEKSYFDLLFGEKSQPGAIRKFLLFIMNYTRTPRVKFGEPLSLANYIKTKNEESEKEISIDLLKEIRADLSIEKARITGPRLKSKEALLKEIMGSEEFSDQVKALAEKQKKKPEEVKNDMRRYLQEMAADVNYSYVQFVYITLSYMWNNIYDGVVVKHDQLDRVRQIAGKHPVVLVPMHRSHIDYLLISYLFFEHGITFPHICAGQNLDFWPVGRIIRKSGGFFIRRSFDGNDAYKESLYAYLKSLVASGHCIEFFIEGTRSRTGKLLMPKMGILSLILRAFAEGACEDIYFVPISVNYDQILEQRAYQKEGSGAEKDKESASELLKVRRIFNKRYGKVYIEFTDPISLKDYCQDRALATQGFHERRKDVSDFAYHLTYHMNKAALVTPISLVSMAILSINHKTCNVDQIRERVSLFKDYLDFKKVEYSDLINFSEQFAYNESIRKLCQRNILKEVETFEENFYMFEDKHRSDLDYYKNNILHFFVSLSCFCKIINNIENFKTLTLEDSVRQFEVIKTLFRKDFVFSERKSLKEHLVKVIEYATHRGFVSYDEKSQIMTKTLDQSNFEDFSAFYGVLDNFLESHLIGLRYIKHNQFNEVEKKSLIKEIITKGKPMYLKDDLCHPEALSRFNMENSFKVFVDLGVLKEKQIDRKKFVYSSVDEPELIEKWITSIQDLLKLLPALGNRADLKKVDSSAQDDDAANLH